MDGIKAEPSEEADRLTREVIGAAIEVHRVLGPGFDEGVYERALRVELELRRTPFESQVPVAIDYKGHPVGDGRMDIVVGGLIVVEMKAVDGLLALHTAQVITYLKATGLRLGLLINFNVPLLKDGLKRIVLS